jgi:hypothetical protein
MSNIVDLDQIKNAPVLVRLAGEVMEVRSPGLVELAEMLEHFNSIDKGNLGAMKKAVAIIEDWIVDEDKKPLLREMTIKQFEMMVQAIVSEVSGKGDLPQELTPALTPEDKDKAKKK